MMWNEYDVKLFGSFAPYGIPFHSRNWAYVFSSKIVNAHHISQPGTVGRPRDKATLN